MYNVQQAEWQKPPGDAHQMAVTVSFFTRKLGFCPLKTVETPLIGSRVHNCLINTLFFLLSSIQRFQRRVLRKSLLTV